jgi:hypothetical protein
MQTIHVFWPRCSLSLALQTPFSEVSAALFLLLFNYTQVDDMLAQAQSVSRSLLEQRRIFGNVQDKLGTIGEKFPAISGLLNAIRRKKSKVRRGRQQAGTQAAWLWWGAEHMLLCILQVPDVCQSRQDSAAACVRVCCGTNRTHGFPAVLLLLLLLQDTLVLSGVIASCIVFTIIYLFSR